MDSKCEIKLKMTFHLATFVRYTIVSSVPKCLIVPL